MSCCTCITTAYHWKTIDKGIEWRCVYQHAVPGDWSSLSISDHYFLFQTLFVTLYPEVMITQCSPVHSGSRGSLGQVQGELSGQNWAGSGRQVLSGALRSEGLWFGALLTARHWLLDFVFLTVLLTIYTGQDTTETTVTADWTQRYTNTLIHKDGKLDSTSPWYYLIVFHYVFFLVDYNALSDCCFISQNLIESHEGSCGARTGCIHWWVGYKNISDYKWNL